MLLKELDIEKIILGFEANVVLYSQLVCYNADTMNTTSMWTRPQLLLSCAHMTNAVS